MKLFGIVTIVFLSASAAQAETYRLIQATGNAEREAARGLSKQECEERKRELKAITAAIGAGGSVTCLPESFFKS
ncbi:hypothetical protein [Rhizobium phaseoli]|uniref:hypothetical protein n=1 Tax=Rhizobium phaseoli TaxID=396 RepID=UPI000BEA8790|nr:hypothetical protein [Rhizobium phaseoli]PDS67966.1 hypothetical protein CO651_31795 [Rhizobium phaseoli]